MQIEHHVFPRLSSWYYPFIQQEVRDVCKKHGVEYVYFPTLVSNVSSMLRYMRKVRLSATSYSCFLLPTIYAATSLYYLLLSTASHCFLLLQ